MRRAWRQPPNSFQRWAAAHPLQWATIIGALVVVSGLRSWSSLGPAWGGVGLLVALAAFAAAFAGARLGRRKVREFDARERP